MTVEYACPVSGERLVRRGATSLYASRCGRSYPVVGGIPVLLPGEADCCRIAETDWNSAATNVSALDFYNRPGEQTLYCRRELHDDHAALEQLASEAPLHGPSLELGSGRGALQGIGAEYVALDYSLTALRSYVSDRYQRVCATAEHIPFPDSTFALVYSVAALEHVPRADLAFEEIHRVLKPGGAIYLAPAWHCTQDNCDGVPVRPFRDLRPGQWVRKLTHPLRTTRLWKAAFALPMRSVRRAAWVVSGRGPARMLFRRLRPDYSKFWMSDSDAVSRLDSHEGALFFHSRGYDLIQPEGTWWGQLVATHRPLIARKPLV